MAKRVRWFNQSRSESKDDAPQLKVAKDRTNLLNQLTLLFIVLTPIVFVCYLLILIDPQLPINPLPPIVPQSAVQITFPPTIPPTPSVTPTRTPRPTNTSTPTPPATSTPVPGASTSAAIETPTPTQSPFNYTFELNYQRAQLYGTSWAGIAGLVLAPDLKHQPNIDVHAWGDAPLGADGQTVVSGTYPQYGPSGWEFTLGDKPAFGKWNVQLVDQDGNPLSPIVEVEMRGDPSANLAYIIFRQNH